MAPQALSYWKRALGTAKAGVERRRAARAVGFVPVQLVDTASGVAAGGGLEIALTSGERLVVREGVSRELLRDALTLLRERC
jgi:enoyl-CoA hydratase/carnithine racemase